MNVYRRLERITRKGDGYPSLDVLLYAESVAPKDEVLAEVPLFARLVADTRDRLAEERKAEEAAREAARKMTAMKDGWDRARAESGLPTEAQIVADAAQAAFDPSALDQHMLRRVRDQLVAYA